MNTSQSQVSRLSLMIVAAGLVVALIYLFFLVRLEFEVGMNRHQVGRQAHGAGIQAAKQTPNLLPLCHPLLVGSVFVNFRIEDSHVEVEAQVDTVDRTGVEMEALTACAVAALTIYDMCKSIDRSMTIGDLTLWEKTGGRSGMYRRPPPLDDELGI